MTSLLRIQFSFRGRLRFDVVSRPNLSHGDGALCPPGGAPEARGPWWPGRSQFRSRSRRIGVRSALLYVGLNPDGTIQVPPLDDPPVTNEAAWYEYSPTPGQPGPAIIEGHVDTASSGHSVFFRLGALRPGDMVDITLADHEVAVFKITAVRLYRTDRFPASVVYGNTGYAALRLITCGGSFDEQRHQYLSNIVAFAALASAYRG